VTVTDWVPLPRSFFARPSVEVAPELLGCVLWRGSPDGDVAVRLVEVEAYDGENDPASHAFRGRTARNAVMFGEPGHVYVYFTYGMHFCVNLVCQPPGRASAVLLRAGEVVQGAELAASRRDSGRRGEQARAWSPRDLARGPARLCQALDIDRGLNGADACAADSPLRILPSAGSRSGLLVSTGPRVGVSQAADRPWRYWLAGDKHVSLYKAAQQRRRQSRPVT
jgi:DNA-3-methyladenine glycosylase